MFFYQLWCQDEFHQQVWATVDGGWWHKTSRHTKEYCSQIKTQPLLTFCFHLIKQKWHTYVIFAPFHAIEIFLRPLRTLLYAQMPPLKSVNSLTPLSHVFGSWRPTSAGLSTPQPHRAPLISPYQWGCGWEGGIQDLNITTVTGCSGFKSLLTGLEKKKTLLYQLVNPWSTHTGKRSVVFPAGAADRSLDELVTICKDAERR